MGEIIEKSQAKNQLSKINKLLIVGGLVSSPILCLCLISELVNSMFMFGEYFNEPWIVIGNYFTAFLPILLNGALSVFFALILARKLSAIKFAKTLMIAFLVFTAVTAVFGIVATMTNIFSSDSFAFSFQSCWLFGQSLSGAICIAEPIAYLFLSLASSFISSVFAIAAYQYFKSSDNITKTLDK